METKEQLRINPEIVREEFVPFILNIDREKIDVERYKNYTVEDFLVVIGQVLKPEQSEKVFEKVVENMESNEGIALGILFSMGVFCLELVNMKNLVEVLE